MPKQNRSNKERIPRCFTSVSRRRRRRPSRRHGKLSVEDLDNIPRDDGLRRMGDEKEQQTRGDIPKTILVSRQQQQQQQQQPAWGIPQIIEIFTAVHHSQQTTNTTAMQAASAHIQKRPELALTTGTSTKSRRDSDWFVSHEESSSLPPGKKPILSSLKREREIDR